MAGIMPMLRNTRAFKKQPQLRLELLYNFVCLILKPYIIFYLSSVFRHYILCNIHINPTFSLTAFHDSELFEDRTLSTTEKKTCKIYKKCISYKKASDSYGR